MAAACMIALPDPAGPQAQALARALGVTITLADVLHRRGRGDDDETRRFLDPRLGQLTPPHEMAGRAAAVDRIARAIRARERIAIFGDYDCDGITSVAILTEVITALGGDIEPLLADRFGGGYGLTDEAASRVLEARPSLLITCDCGSSDHPRLERLRAAGVDVVVIDHHLVPDEPIPVVAFLNPHRPDCPFPYKNLSSCGLALSLAAGLRAVLDSRLDVRRWLDLVAIGTVADVVPLDGDNRVLVRAGMRMIQSSPRPGLRWLASLANVALDAGVTSDTIAFDIAPRLNAPGRLGSARPALDLLMASDATRAREGAAQLEELRTQRRQIQARIAAEALEEIEREGFCDDPAIVVGRQGWHPGVVGIVAAQLVERFGRPAVVVAFEGATGRGSARGPAGSRLYDLLSRCKDAPMSFGGHQAAAGVHVGPEALDRFRGLFNAAVQGMGGGERAEGAARQAEVRLHDGDRAFDVVEDLARLEPCGVTNPSPVMVVPGVTVLRAQAVKGGHLQVKMQTPAGEPLHGFGLSMGERAAEISALARANVLGRLRRDTWRGGNAVAMRVEAVEPA